MPEAARPLIGGPAAAGVSSVAVIRDGGPLRTLAISRIHPEPLTDSSPLCNIGGGFALLVNRP